MSAIPKYMTTEEACRMVAEAAEEKKFSRQAWWQRVKSLGLKPWKEHGRMVWWDEDAVNRVIAARKR